MGDALVPDLKNGGLEPPPAELERRSYRVPILLLALAWLATLGALVWRERRAAQPYRRIQLQHQALRGPVGGQVLGPVEVGPSSDRCPTCHLGINEPLMQARRPEGRAERPLMQERRASRRRGDPKGAPSDNEARAEHPLRAGLANPYRAHPGRYLVDHPPRRFGCTSCHGAGGERLDRCLPAEGDPEGRALSAARAQASCLRCHPEPEALPGAARLATGLGAYRRLGCGGCHAVRGLDPGRRVGPPFDAVAGKLPAAYLRSFLLDPQQLRPGTAMPSFFSEEALAGAPAFSAAEVRRRRATEVEELLAFLLSLRAPSVAPSDRPASLPVQAHGDPAAGLRRLEKLGCPACHLAGPAAERWRAAGLGGVGPDLRGARARLSRSWVEAWLSGPRAVWPETRMPDFRLAAEERADLAAALGGPEQWSRARPAAGAALRGRALAERLGCGGCHESRALRGVPPSGPQLDGFGDKRLELLDWAHAEPRGAERTVWRWTELKLDQPLRFDRHPGVLAMPRQRLRPGERDGLLLLLRGLVAEGRPARPPAAVAAQRRGERLFEELACRQCHRLGGRGGALRALHALPSEAPPSLDGEGGKVQPAWLFQYLGRPEPLRPWLAPRMPTPAADASGRQALAAALAGRDRASFPFVDQAPLRLPEPELEAGLLLFERLQCLRCHLLSNAPALKPGELSPDLALGASRLRRGWISRFILAPQTVLPGTQMPNLFPLIDEDDPTSRSTPQPGLLGGSVARQVEALTDLSLWWGTAEAARRASRPTRPRSPLR